MKTLLITNYWAPWNHSGTFRWIGFGRYMNFDVLTSKHKKGFYDETIPSGAHTVFRRECFRLPACLCGIFLAFYSIFRRKYDIYVFTAPPNTLVLAAWLNQIIGRKVVLDMRDMIGYPEQRLKVLNPIYRFFYNRVKNKVVAAQFFDESAYCIYHGYDTHCFINTNMRLMNIYRNNIL